VSRYAGGGCPALYDEVGRQEPLIAGTVRKLFTKSFIGKGFRLERSVVGQDRGDREQDPETGVVRSPESHEVRSGAQL
jgi:hypothetical protein